MSGIRSILALPRVYRTFWTLLGGPKYIQIIIRDHVRPALHARILDLGCGPATLLPYVPGTEYVGIDNSTAYIQFGRKHFPQATFVCERISRYALPKESYFDIVLALGLIHHLDDAEARQLFEIAHLALRPGGRLVTLDGVFTENQSRLARAFVSRDRGEFVRDREGYLRIASKVFAEVKPTIRQDLSRIPYTHIIMECTR